MAEASADPEDALYLLRGVANLEPDSVDCGALMRHFALEPPLAKMAKTSLPTTYHHLLRGVGEPAAPDARGGLLELLRGVPFDRPIEPLPESVVKSALQLPAATKSGPVLHALKPQKASGLVHAPPPTAKDRQVADEKQRSKSRDEKDRKEKKEKKRKKREREDAHMLQTLLAPLVTELRGLTWAGWIVSGKAANPFIQKITRDNCKRLGVPNYFDYVKEPMDLTRMKEKVEKAEYARVEQFTSDIKLLVANAKTFNREGEPVFQMAIELEQLYLSKLTGYRTTLEDLQQERKKRKKEKKKKKDKKKDK